MASLTVRQLDDTNRLTVVRRDIARLHTLRREREIAAAESMREDT